MPASPILLLATRAISDACLLAYALACHPARASQKEWIFEHRVETRQPLKLCEFGRYFDGPQKPTARLTMGDRARERL
jgi:hypothetical protein